MSWPGDEWNNGQQPSGLAFTTVSSPPGEFPSCGWLLSLGSSRRIPFQRWLPSVLFHFFLSANFIAHSLLLSCLGREMLYIKMVIILFYGSGESIFSSLQVLGLR